MSLKTTPLLVQLIVFSFALLSYLVTRLPINCVELPSIEISNGIWQNSCKDILITWRADRGGRVIFNDEQTTTLLQNSNSSFNISLCDQNSFVPSYLHWRTVTCIQPLTIYGNDKTGDISWYIQILLGFIENFCASMNSSCYPLKQSMLWKCSSLETLQSYVLNLIGGSISL